MFTNIVDCDLDAVRIGQPVQVVFKPTDWRPAGAHVHAAEAIARGSTG